MKEKSSYWTLMTAALCVQCSQGTAQTEHSSNPSLTEKSPNVVVILMDDMGYSDLGCYGGELQTPALDQLADEGLRLTQFRNSGMSVCSRMSLMTGKWWPQATRTFAQSPLLPEQLKKTGYRTALIGKWHLPGDPMNRGFDHFYGFLGGFSNHFTGSADYRLDRAPFTDFGPDYYSSDAFSDRAVEFIRKNADKTNQHPFFLYLSYQAPHNPLQAPHEDIMRHRGNYLKGWQAIREERFQRQKNLGIFPADATLPAYPENLPDWNSLSPEQKDLEDLRMSVYAAMIERVDRGIARVMKALQESGVSEHTIVLFLSDNGADSFSNTDDAMLKNNKLPGDVQSNWQLGTGWAYASVTPWRMYKISQHGGGVTSGAILWSPKYVPRKGEIDHTPLHVVDIYPTLCQLIGVEAPNTMNGESFLPLFRASWNRTKPMYFQFTDNRAVRTNKWTMVEVDDSGWQLYDIENDPLEQHDLVKEYPQVVKQLENQWNTWWKNQTGKSVYVPESTQGSPHYSPQGDRGSGKSYVPRAMPARLQDRYQ